MASTTNEDEGWDFSGVQTVYLGDVGQLADVVFDGRDVSTDFSYRQEMLEAEFLKPETAQSREVTLRKQLADLEARRAKLVYKKVKKPVVRERIKKMRKEVDLEIARLVNELTVYDVMKV